MVLALVLAFTALCAPAQMPTDNLMWKSRCDALHKAGVSNNGAAPVWLLNAPGTVPGPQWTEFGWDRERAGQHAVACVFFYLGAIADHKMQQTHANRIHSIESARMGVIAYDTVHGIKPPARYLITKAHAELAEIPKPSLTAAAEQAMMDTAGVVPTSPTPTSGPALASDAR